MVYLEFVSDDGSWVIYDYMPEKRDASRGTIAVSRETGERRLLKRSPAGELSAYHSHAWRRVEEMIEDGVLKHEAYSAWY